MSSFWTRVRVPFAQWMGEEGSLRDAIQAGAWPARTKLILGFELPPQKLERAGEGVLRFELELDDVLLE